jgi:hypothetical protein
MDYFLFEHAAQPEYRSGSLGVIETPVTNITPSLGAQRDVQKSAFEIVTVSAENIDLDTLLGLRVVAASHSVQEWLDNKWQNVLVISSAISYNTQDNLHTVSIKFQRQPVYTIRN